MNLSVCFLNSLLLVVSSHPACEQDGLNGVKETLYISAFHNVTGRFLDATEKLALIFMETIIHNLRRAFDWEDKYVMTSVSFGHFEIVA